jgi:predicted phage tail component-like protein
MIGEFTFNSVASGDFGLVCKSVKRPLLPAAKVKRVDLSSTSGAYDFTDNEYSLRLVTMRIAYIGTSFEEMRSRARDIAAWLSTSTWAKLVINDEPDKYYLAKVTDEIDLTSMWEAGEAEINFDCQPFAYSVDEEEELYEDITSQHVCEFTNPGTREINYRSPQGSKSLITITGSWSSLSFAMNGKTLTYGHSASSKTLIIDNILMEATLDGSNVFGYLGGSLDDFLPIIPGANSLTVNGTGLNIDVTVTYIPLWI